MSIQHKVSSVFFVFVLGTFTSRKDEGDADAWIETNTRSSRVMCEKVEDLLSSYFSCVKLKIMSIPSFYENGSNRLVLLVKFLSRVKLFKYRFKFEERIIKLFDIDFINISDTFRILEKSVDSSDLDFYVDLSGFQRSKNIKLV